MSERLFLSDDELTELTGYRVKPKRLEALRVMGIAFELSEYGRIRVRSDFNRPSAPLLSEATIARHARPARLLGVYFLVRGRTVVYVGKSSHVLERIGSHVRNPRFEFDGFHWLTAESEAAALEMEAAYIRAFKPLYNIAGKPGPEPVFVLGPVS